MWAFTKPSAGPMGARNREQVLPSTHQYWDEAPTPGSASSQRRRPMSAVRPSDTSFSKGLYKQQAASTGSMARRPSSASASTRPAPSRPTSAKPVKVMTQAQPSLPTVPSVHTQNGSLMGVNHIPGAARAEKWMAQLKADGYLVSPTASFAGTTSRMSMSRGNSQLSIQSPGQTSYSPLSPAQTTTQYSGSVPVSPIPKARQSLANTSQLDITSLRELSPENQKALTAPGARRLRGSIRGTAQDVAATEGLHGQTHVRSKVCRSNVDKACIPQGAAARSAYHITSREAAIEVDQKFQRELQAQWLRETDQTEQALSIQRRQMVQFFNFLREPDGEGLIPGGERYVPKELRDRDSIEADWSQTEVLRHGPELDYSEVIEFNVRQVEFLRRVLRSFAMISRPAGKISRNLLDDGGPCADRLFRPTFARFLIDSRLVQGTGSFFSEGYSHLYHKAVRIFDSASQQNQSKQDMALIQQVGPTLSSLRSVTSEQCIAIVGALIGKTDDPQRALFEYFEKDLPEAWKTVQALERQCRGRTEAAKRIVKDEMLDEDALQNRRKEMVALFGSPPKTYNGSMKDWIRGMKMWIQTIEEGGNPDAIAERVESNFAVENYCGDMLVEPGVIHVAEAYSHVFKALFEAYYDEERVSWSSDVKGGPPTSTQKPHMSAAAFFRFCVDFFVYPMLGSFDDVRSAYAAAESLEVLSGYKSKDIMKRAFKKVFAGVRSREPGTASDDSSEDSMFDSDEDSNDEEEGVEEDKDTKSRADSEENFLPLIQVTSALTHSLNSFSRRNSSGHGAPPARPGTAKGDRPSQAGESPSLGPRRSASKSNNEHRQSSKGQPDCDQDSQAARKGTADSLGASKEANIGKPVVDKSVHKLLVPAGAVMRRRSSLQGGAAEKAAAEAAAAAVAAAAAAAKDPAAKDKAMQMSRKRRGSLTGSPVVDQENIPGNSPSLVPVGQGRRGSTMRQMQEEELPVVRAKHIIDLSWIKKPFTSMSDHERRAYALLSALNNCVTDRFLCVRGLFLSCGEGGVDGLVDAAAIMRALDKLRFVHDYTPQHMQAFVTIIDPKAEEGLIETAELEKAAGQVQKDQDRRWPWLKEAAVGQTSKKCTSLNLGDEARRQDDEDCWFRRDRKDKKVTAFGHAAFTEALLRVALSSLHSGGVALQAVAPSGVKGLWMIAFLRFQYERLQQTRGTRKLDALDPQLHMEWKRKIALHAPMPSARPLSTAASRPNTGASSAARSASSPPGQWTWGQPGNWPNKDIATPVRMVPSANSLLPRGGNPPSGSAAGGSAAGPPMLNAPPKEAPPNSGEPPPDGPKYCWNISRLLDKHQDIFTQTAAESSVSAAAGEEQFLLNPAKALDDCQQCGLRRDHQGLGNIFCNECSGIDSGPLSKSLLFPVLHRRRLKRIMAAESKAGLPACSSAGASVDHDDVTLMPDPNGRVSGEVRSGNPSRANSKDDPPMNRAPTKDVLSSLGSRRNSKASAAAASPRQQ